MTPFHLPIRLLAAISIATLLAAGCGGGGSEGSAPAAASAPATPSPPTPPSVQSVAPLEGAVDTVVTVGGSGLSRVVSIALNGVAAQYTLVSDAQLTFRVPAGATTGPIALVGQGFNVQASSSFRVTGIPTITAVSATNAAISTNVTITGRDLNRASAFWVGSEVLAIISATPDRVIARTPPRAVTGRIEATEVSSNVRRMSSFDLAVWTPISITGFSPASAIPGEAITVTGVGLDNVSEVGFTSAPVTAVDGSSTRVATVPDSNTGNTLTVRIPATASTGQIALRSLYEPVGTVSTTALTVLPKVLVNRLEPVVSPATAGSAAGAALYSQKVSVPNSAPLSCEDCHGPANVFRTRPQFASLTDASLAARITLAINNPAYGMSAFAGWSSQMRLDVAQYILNGAPAPAAVATIRLAGANFSAVTAARIGTGGEWTTALLTNRQPTAMTLTPASPLPVGTPLEVELIASGQPNIKAGVVNVQNNGAIYLFGAEAAQVHSRQIDNPTLRLTPGRPFLLRAVVLASSSVPAPAVRATIARSGVPVGTVTLTGPPLLTGSYVPENNATVFSGVVPGAWVAAGMQVAITVATAPTMELTFSPTVGTPAKLHVVLVPIQIGTSVGTPPSAAAVQDALARTWPVARQDIAVETRSPMSVNVTIPVTGDQMQQINLSLHQRQLNEPSKVFYGIVPTSAIPTNQPGGFTAGMALSIPDLVNPSSWLMSASGWDQPEILPNVDRLGLGWASGMQTLLHELGHLHSRRHAPCAAGGLSVGGPDPNYPYKDTVLGASPPEGPGRIGPEPLYSSTYSDNTPGAIAAPHLPNNPPAGLTSNARLGDLMGYCKSSWFSTYNYDYVQKFIENRTAAAQATTSQARVAAAQATATGKRLRGYLTLSGLITGKGVMLAPAQILPQPPVPPHSDGPYTMTIRTTIGEIINVNFTASDVSHADAKSFTVVVPDPGPVQSVEVSKSLRAIPLAKASTRTRALSAGAPAPKAAQAFTTWALEDEHVTVRWNTAADPFLAVTLVHPDGRRELIASELATGEVRVPTRTRSAGTKVELTLGSEFGARTLVAE